MRSQESYTRTRFFTPQNDVQNTPKNDCRKSAKRMCFSHFANTLSDLRKQQKKRGVKRGVFNSVFCTPFCIVKRGLKRGAFNSVKRGAFNEGKGREEYGSVLFPLPLVRGSGGRRRSRRAAKARRARRPTVFGTRCLIRWFCNHVPNTSCKTQGYCLIHHVQDPDTRYSYQTQEHLGTDPLPHAETHGILSLTPISLFRRREKFCMLAACVQTCGFSARMRARPSASRRGPMSCSRL